MSNICLIPAREKSKRISWKNFEKILNKPIIEYPIEVAIEADFDRIILSSDCEWAKRFEKKYDIEYMQRSEKNSNDDSTLFDVCKEVLDNLDISKGSLCILYPTACLLTLRQILDAYEMLLYSSHDTIFPVIETGIYNEKILQVFEGRVNYKYPQFNQVPSQACSKMYSHSGTFFYCDIKKLLKNKNIITDNCGYIKLKPWEACEIDTLDDWQMMEIFLKHKKGII